MANGFDSLTLEAILAPQTQALQALAMRPQKSQTTTTSTSTPYALEDLVATRNRIGESTRALDDALKARETFGYTLANALAGVPQQEGAGSWLSDFARGFGGGMSARTNAAVDRAQKKYEAEMKDLADILAFDKAMGETQVQNQVIDYKEMPWGGAGGKSSAQGGAQSEIPVLNPEYWDQMIANFDKSRPTEASYRAQSQARRALENKTTVLGDPDEDYARDQFATAKGRDFLPMARNALKGAGQITDFEDKKYTQWLNEVQDPVQLKDTAVRIVKAVAMKNGWSKEQEAKGLELLGLTSKAEDLLPQQKQYEPERVKPTGINIEDILKKHGAKRVD